jgi:hypothetical protein
MEVETDPEELMGRPKSAPKSHSIKITNEAHEAARIASGYTGETFVDLISRVVRQECVRIIEQYHAQWVEKEKLGQDKPDEEPRKKK